MKNLGKKGKTGVKKRVFRGKMGVIGLEKHEHPTKIERQNGAKRRLFS